MELKCTYLSEQANLAGLESPDFVFKHLRNKIAHVQQGDDLELFEAITPSPIENAERDMLEWLDLIGGTLNYRRLGDTKAATEKLASDIREAGVSVSTAVDHPPHQS